MPNRILRDGFVDSESISALSDWAHRVYSNLIVKVDDAGRFDGRLEVLRSHLFPLGTSHRADQFRKAIDELAAPKSEAGQPLPPLVILYDYDGKPFIQLVKVQRCGKSTTSRYPWKDGSFEFTHVDRQTRDGKKSFVTTSLPDGVPTPCVPHADGVTTDSKESNTETETDTKTDTNGSDLSSQVRQYIRSHSKMIWNRQDEGDLTRIVEKVGWPLAKQWVEKGIAERAPPIGYAIGCFRNWAKGQGAKQAAKKEAESRLVFREDGA